MAAFVGSTAAVGVKRDFGTPVANKSAMSKSVRTPVAVIALPTGETGSRWRRAEEPLFPLTSTNDFHAVVDSSHVEDAVVIAVLEQGNVTSGVVESQLRNQAQQFPQMSFYRVEDKHLSPEYAGKATPRLMVFSKGESVEDQRLRMANLGGLRSTLRRYV